MDTAWHCSLLFLASGNGTILLPAPVSDLKLGRLQVLGGRPCTYLDSASRAICALIEVVLMEATVDHCVWED